MASNIVSRTNAALILNRLGFGSLASLNGSRLTQAVRDFQRGYNLGSQLAVDGIVGPKTSAALNASNARRKAGRSTASDHFSYREFACKCGGRYPGCRRIVVERDLLVALEKLRAKCYARGGLPIVSGFRCPSHNRAVGGATSSQHMSGRAADIPGRATGDVVDSIAGFGGLGINRASGLVVHADVRGAGAAAVRWYY